LVSGTRIDGRVGTRFPFEFQSVADRLQKTFFEYPEGGLGIALVRYSLESGAVVNEQRRFGIVTVNETVQQLVEIEPDDGGGAGKWNGVACGFGTDQRPELASATPGQQQRNEGLEQPAHSRSRTPGTARDQPETAVAAAEGLHEQARITVRPGMQHERRLEFDPFESAHPESGPGFAVLFGEPQSLQGQLVV